MKTYEHELPRPRPTLQWVGRVVQWFDRDNQPHPAIVAGVDPGWKHGDPEPALILRVMTVQHFEPSNSGSVVRDFTVRAEHTTMHDGFPECWGWVG